jgi:hypothetical protein
MILYARALTEVCRWNHEASLVGQTKLRRRVRIVAFTA